MIGRIINKIVRLTYKAIHPALWHKGIEINGIPSIHGFHNCHIGRNVSFNSHVYIQGAGGVSIGDCVTLSRGVTILTVGLDTSVYSESCLQPMRPHKLSSVVVGDGVWLGANSMVMPGVNISPRIIVAAGAVVTHDLDKEDWLYGGIPAKPIKSLK